MTAAPALADVRSSAAGFRGGGPSPRDALEACLARIEAWEPRLNAFALVLADAARAAADRAGAELAAGRDRGPLHGIAVTVKDLIDVGGVPTGYGSDPAFRTIPKANAALVDRLERAGAVILGKSNLLEFAYGAVNPAVGQTNNPWDLARTSGGSSGGGAAAVAAGLATLAVGTDTGGSIRVPAAYCGVVGLKPTFGLVPTEGAFPLSWTLDHAGPIARTSADALALLDALAGLHGGSEPIPPGHLRLGVVLDHAAHRFIRPDVREAFERACAAIRARGAVLVERRIPELDGMAEVLMDILLPEAGLIHAELMAKHGTRYGPQTRAQIEAGRGVTAMAYLRAMERRRAIAAAFDRALEGLDALIAPSVPWVAPHEDPPVDGDEGFAEMHCLAPANIAGLPSVSIHAGLGEGGMPVGLVLTATREGDRRLMRIAAGIEGVLPPALAPGVEADAPAGARP